MVTRSTIVYGLKLDIISSINKLLLYMKASTVLKCLKVAYEIFKQEILQLMLKVSLMRPRCPQVNTLGGTVDLLLVMT